MLFGKFASKIYVIKASIAYKKGDTDSTLAMLDKAYKTGIAKASVVTTYGYMLLKHGKPDQAIKIFEEQLAYSKLSDNERYDVNSNYALALWKKGQISQAISLLEETISRYKNTNIYGSLGYLYNLNNNLDKALSFNLEAYAYNSDNGVILDNLGQTYYLLGDYEKANEMFKKLMSNNPKFPEAFYDYALVLEKMGEKEKCIDNLKNALLYNTNYLSAITAKDIKNKLAEMEN